MGTQKEQSGGAHGPREQADGAADSGWERVVAIAAALLIVATFAFLAWEAVTTPADALPAVAVEVDTVAAQHGTFLVGIRAVNRGGATAAGLTIEGVLRADSGEVERSATTLDFVPAHSHRIAGLFFTRDPRRYRMEIRPVSFTQP